MWGPLLAIYGVCSKRESSLETPRPGTASVVRTLACDCMLRLCDYSLAAHTSLTSARDKVKE